jgi:fatty-acyl-CoA synthase
MKGLMQDTPLTLQMVLRRAATTHGSKHVATATGAGVDRSTYADLADRITRLASALRGLGIGAGDRVATFAWNSQRHLELYLAVPCAGAVLHTLNPRLHPAQIAWIVNHAEDRVAFVDASLLEAWQAVEGLESVREVVVMDDLGGTDVPDEHHEYEALLAAADAAFAWPRLDEGTAAAMCYTSGTTGEPKGVVYSHRSTMLHTMAALFADALALSERDVCLPIVPQFHANAWGTPYAALYTGANLAMPGRFMAHPPTIADLVEQEQVTVSAAVPTVWFGVLQAIKGGTVDPAKLASLERIACGGSAVPEALMRGYDELGITIVHAWGMTETSPVGSVARVKSTVPEQEVLRTRLSQGLPVPGLEVRLVTDDEQIAPWDGKTMGELQISGPWIADAYYDPHAPDLRGGHDRFVEDDDGRRWLRTGDVAVIDGEGYLTLVDRTKDLVKSGGEWISTVQLENLLIAHDKVREAAVIAVPDAKWDERPLACVVPADESVTAEELRAYLAEHVASWQVPDEVAFIEEVPKTAVGKFDKKVLRARFAEERPRS